MTEERITSSTGGQKCSKPARFDLLDSNFLWKVAEVMGYGCGKYAPHNWRLGYDWGLSMASCQRHLHQFWQGEADDQETGLPHLAHAAFHLMALHVFSLGSQYRQFDSRALLIGNRRPVEFMRPQKLEDGLELTPDGEVVMVPDFPRGLEDKTIEDLDRSLANTAEMPVVRMRPDRSDAIAETAKNTRFHDDSETVVVEPNIQVCPDSTNVFFTDEEMVAKLRNAVSPLQDQTRSAIRIQIENDIRKKRAAEVGDRMEQVLKGLGGISHERPE